MSNIETLKTDESVIYTPKFYLRGSVGAFLGAVVGAIPWAIVFKWGWFVGWLGLVIGFCAKKGYEIFGGKKGNGKIGIVCGATIFGVITGNLLPDLFEFALMIYRGEIIGAAYSDIPSLYIDWIRYNELLSFTLRNLGLGLVFGILGLSSIFKEMAAEINPKALEFPLLTPMHEKLTKEELDSSLKRFTVTYSKKTRIIYSCVFLIPVFIVIFFTIAGMVSAQAPEYSTLGTAISLASSLFLLAIFAVPAIICFRKLKKFAVEVNNDTIKINPVFGKEKTLQFKDITKVSIFPATATTAFYFINAYSDNKRLFKVNNSFNGSMELLRRLKAEGITFIAAASHL